MLSYRKRGKTYLVRGTVKLGKYRIRLRERAISADDDLSAGRICRELYDVCIEGMLQDDGINLIGYRMSLVNGARRAPRADARVYAIWAEGPDLIKIGFSGDVRKRHSALQVTSPHTLHLLMDIPGGEDLERELHFRFRDFRVRGEWFKPGPPVLELLARFANVEPMPDAIALRLPTRKTSGSIAEFDPGSTSLQHS
jgi:hypothetical protein